MLKITQDLKKHMVDHLGLAADATDDVCRDLVGKSIMDGKLDLDKVKELTVDKATDAEKRVQEMVNKSLSPVMEMLTKLASAQAGTPAPAGGDGASLTAATPAAALNDAVKAYAAAAMAGTAAGASGDAPAAQSQKDIQIRVKSVVEQFDDTRTAATWDKSEKEYMKKNFGGVRLHTGEGPGSRPLDMPTDRSKAIAGAWFKHMINKQFRSSGAGVPTQYRMSELDTNLVLHALHESPFVGPIGYTEVNEKFDNAVHWFEGQKVTQDIHRKALLDDTTSGGLEAVPIEFDNSLILTPLLNGELYPLVNSINVTRRRIEAAAMANPTMSWGTAEGTEVALFDTSSFVTAFDNNIYPVMGAVELGLDFLEDSPLEIGRVLVERYGEAFLTEMDKVIAIGDGTTQPEGLFTKSGLTDNSFGSVAPTVGGYEGLMFGVSKAYRQKAGNRMIFLSNDTSYARSRAIAVGTTDARRIFGMDEMSYRLFEMRYAVQNSIANTKIGAFCMNQYRLYRRQGLQVRVVTNDSQLARSNKQLIVVRARFGGALEQAAAGCITTTAQA